MKIRTGFVSNSSSTSFVIENKTSEAKTLVDFVKENPQLIEQFLEQYSWHKGEKGYTQRGLIALAKKRNLEITIGRGVYTFGDEDGDVIGWVFDYILRGGGESESFKWKFDEYNR